MPVCKRILFRVSLTNSVIASPYLPDAVFILAEYCTVSIRFKILREKIYIALEPLIVSGRILS